MRPVLPLLLIALGLPPASAAAQDLVFSLASDVQGPASVWTDEELHRLDSQGLAAAFLPREALTLLFGDADGNGALDDEPVDIDAVEVLGGAGLGDWLFSTTTTTAIAGSPAIRDGDVFRFDPQGGVQVVYDESFFEAMTGTTGIDVDAFALAPSGELYFSFAEDEATTSAALTAQNGGNGTLDEQCVFRIDPGASEAVIHLDQAQVVALVNQALGTSVTTVVDTTGVALDPQGSAGDLLLCVGSTSQSLRGRVVCTRNGGQVFTQGGTPVDPAAFPTAAAPSLDALAVTLGASHPVLRARPANGSASAGGPCVLALEGFQPLETVQLVVTDALLPGPGISPPGMLAGFGAIFPDPTQSLWLQSLQSGLSLAADATGRVQWSFDFGGLPAGIRAVVQGVGLSGFRLTSPAALSIEP